ncbi:metabotropic glycine receptor-like [Ornithodoros turicata]|uniref:metabotropic glycine receptor-like n=1 Tax=Ornithodoros turicata TaxID=34597 RepID=UPI00313989A9
MGQLSGILLCVCIVVLGHLAPAPVLCSQRYRRPRSLHLSPIVQKFLQQGRNVSAALQLLHETNTWEPSLCGRVSLSVFGVYASNRTGDVFQRQAQVAVRTANLLTSLSARIQNDTELVYGEDLYYTLARMNVLSEEGVVGSGILVLHGHRETPLLSVFAYRPAREGPKGIAFHRNYTYDEVSVDRCPWFSKLSTANYTEWLLRRYGASALDVASGLQVARRDGVWTSPYYDCGVTDTWVVTFVVPFLGVRQNGTVLFRGVATVNIALGSLDIDQCAGDDLFFSNSHRCDSQSAECVAIQGRGFQRGAYKCRCKEGFYFPSSGIRVPSSGVPTGSTSAVSSSSTAEGLGSALEVAGAHPFHCLPCPARCSTCKEGQSCFVEYNMAWRSLALGLQSFCTTVTLVLMVIVFRLRKSKVFAAAMWVLLEVILVGALIIYQTIIIRYFEPTTTTCLIEPWFREVGFIVLYGAVLLKIYRILAEFQTRKAHRVCVRDKDLLKYLLGFVLVVAGYMSAWTAVVMDNWEKGHSILQVAATPASLHYLVCRALWWDYVTEFGEVLFLLLGIYLAYCIRNAKVECYTEKWTLCCSVYIEALFSLSMYIIRHAMSAVLEPDHVFLLYFIRCHCTVTVILFLLFAPKLWYHHRPPNLSTEHRSRHFSSYDPDPHPENLKLHEAVLSNGEVDIADINLADMDPEDIRAELRRVYTQLQVLRNKTMRKDNPHISKRRGGRKVTHRRFSLQPFHHKHKQQHHHEQEVTEVSKTPEDSTASGEAGPVPDGPSVTSVSGYTRAVCVATTDDTPSTPVTPSRRN